MNPADTLRRRIALYRRYLSQGVDADFARIYLNEIEKAETLLAEIESGDTSARKLDDHGAGAGT